MASEAVPLNPALAAAISMPPALVQAIQEDPELLVALTRGQLAIVQDRLIRKALGDPEITYSSLVAIHEILAKNANLKGAQPSGPGGAGAPQVLIQILRAPGKETVVIDGKAQPVLVEKANDVPHA